jgi:hypothetical protein
MSDDGELDLNSEDVDDSGHDKGHSLEGVSHHNDPHRDEEEEDGGDNDVAVKLVDMKVVEKEIEVDEKEESTEAGQIDGTKPLKVLYCPMCSMPPEYCEFNIPEVFEKCLPWILANCKNVLSKAVLAKATGEEMKEEEDNLEVRHSLHTRVN